MLIKDRFKGLVPEIASIKRVAREGGKIFWSVFNEAGERIGYAFFINVPETNDPSLDTEEFDKYQVLCVLNLDYKVMALDIGAHPAGPERLWAEGIVETEFGQQYVNLDIEEFYLVPEGAIDAISDGTLSSKLVTDSIREKILEIMELAKE